MEEQQTTCICCFSTGFALLYPFHVCVCVEVAILLAKLRVLICIIQVTGLMMDMQVSRLLFYPLCYDDNFSTHQESSVSDSGMHFIILCLV